ncbi:unnamed protein product [Haemonchus placei]|uniref:G protein-coupled receptor n=1 Tax=Haemonchus placei TaxID=6290 RepID=A0A158QRD5_HAEPC|nr:unnamed protein product [Haemonchus placei]
MTKSSLDTWNYALFSLECALNVAFFPVVLLVFYICISQMNLHRNFRVTLFLIAVGYLISDITRIIIIISRMCCIALDNPSNMMTLILVQGSGMYLSMFAWLLLIIERAIASVFVGVYEVQFRGYVAPAILSGAVLMLTAVLLILSSFLSADMNFIIMGMQIGIVALSFTALIVIIIFNKASYKKRHDARIQLASRYQLDENIRVGRYLIPVACNDMLTKEQIQRDAYCHFADPFEIHLEAFICLACFKVKNEVCRISQRLEILFLMLITYSIFFTDIPLGQDTTHLSHAYDLLSAYQRMFFGLALTIRSEKFDHIMKRNKRTAAAVQNQIAATSNYYDELKHMW